MPQIIGVRAQSYHSVGKKRYVTSAQGMIQSAVIGTATKLSTAEQN